MIETLQQFTEELEESTLLMVFEFVAEHTELCEQFDAFLEGEFSHIGFSHTSEEGVYTQFNAANSHIHFSHNFPSGLTIVVQMKNDNGLVVVKDFNLTQRFQQGELVGGR